MRRLLASGAIALAAAGLGFAAGRVDAGGSPAPVAEDAPGAACPVPPPPGPPNSRM